MTSHHEEERPTVQRTLADEMGNLADLKSRGVFSDDEFAHLKRELLGKHGFSPDRKLLGFPIKWPIAVIVLLLLIGGGTGAGLYLALRGPGMVSLRFVNTEYGSSCSSAGAAFGLFVGKPVVVTGDDGAQVAVGSLDSARAGYYVLPTGATEMTCAFSALIEVADNQNEYVFDDGGNPIASSRSDLVADGWLVRMSTHEQKGTPRVRFNESATSLSS